MFLSLPVDGWFHMLVDYFSVLWLVHFSLLLLALSEETTDVSLTSCPPWWRSSFSPLVSFNIFLFRHLRFDVTCLGVVLWHLQILVFSGLPGSVGRNLSHHYFKYYFVHLSLLPLLQSIIRYCDGFSLFFLLFSFVSFCCQTLRSTLLHLLVSVCASMVEI